jgi:cobalt-zinc-cadmium efflux system membrane fusion protein
MYLSAYVETGGALVTALPDEAIIDYNGKKYIFIADEEERRQGKASDGSQNFTMLEIQTSNRELGFTEVKVPDSVSQTNVVVKGAYALLSKMKNSEEEGHAH